MLHQQQLQATGRLIGLHKTCSMQDSQQKYLCIEVVRAFNSLTICNYTSNLQQKTVQSVCTNCRNGRTCVPFRYTQTTAKCEARPSEGDCLTSAQDSSKAEPTSTLQCLTVTHGTANAVHIQPSHPRAVHSALRVSKDVQQCPHSCKRLPRNSLLEDRSM